MKQHEAKQFLPIIQAWADGKAIQSRETDADSWSDVITGEINTFYAAKHFRIKPTPKLRAWTISEVPLGAKFRCRDKELKIVGAGEAGHKTFRADALFLSYHPDNWYPGNYFYLQDCITSDSKPEHSLDGGKTWLPCGVMEDAS